MSDTSSHEAGFQPDHKTRCGYVALIGAPNAGKSTLVNQIVGSKVSIVTHKVQTTRSLIRGIALKGENQVIFVDTPGIFAPKRRLETAMVNAAWGGARDADVIGMILDRLADIKLPKVLILNKIDLVKRDTLLALAQQINERLTFDETFMVSALNGDHTGDLLDYFSKHMPEGPWLYPEDMISDLPMRQLASEITREKVFLRLHQELPYASTVETEKWEQKKDGSVRIEQVIYVERDNQKMIVLGKGGATIKAISMAARKELSELLEANVHLFLFVKVRERWVDDPERYREMGIDFPI
jgi:GTP-binding protein Era